MTSQCAFMIAHNGISTEFHGLGVLGSRVLGYRTIFYDAGVLGLGACVNIIKFG